MLREHTTYEVTCDLCDTDGGLFDTRREAESDWRGRGGSLAVEGDSAVSDGDYCHGCESGEVASDE